MSNRLVTCYPIPGKRKALLICNAFAEGVRRVAGYESAAVVLEKTPDVIQDGACFFYGVRPQVAHIWRQAESTGREWLYADNSFWDDTRETKFRVGRNVVQMYEFPKRDYPKFRRPILPWREGGEHIVVCPQSDEFMMCVERFSERWPDWIARRIAMYSTRPLKVRKKGEKRPLVEDLNGAWALVTHTSAAANEALIHGIPTFTTGLCAATAMSRHDLAQIENPRLPDGREEWAAAVAAHEWTLDEMRNGTCWKALQ